MFKKSEGGHRKKGFGLFGIFRMFLSLVIFAVLSLGVYQAYKSFSGIDPLTANPQTIVNNFISSDAAYKLITSLLTFNPKLFLNNQKVIKDAQVAPEQVHTNSPLLYRFAIVTDSHNDNQNLKKALTQAKAANAQFVIGLGDFTNVGTEGELADAKAVLDTSELPYYVTAGDHDLWDSRDKGLPASKDFNDLFGATYQSFSFKNTRFILIFDSDNYLGLDSGQLSWIDEKLAALDSEKPPLTLVLTSSPLYHPSSDHVVGKTNPELKKQAEELTQKFKAAGVAEIIAGDTHFYTRYSDPKTDLKMTTVGAITSDRNPQSPRYALVDVFEDGSYNIQDTPVK